MFALSDPPPTTASKSAALVTVAFEPAPAPENPMPAENTCVVAVAASVPSARIVTLFEPVTVAARFAFTAPETVANEPAIATLAKSAPALMFAVAVALFWAPWRCAQTLISPVLARVPDPMPASTSPPTDARATAPCAPPIEMLMISVVAVAWFSAIASTVTLPEPVTLPSRRAFVPASTFATGSIT